MTNTNTSKVRKTNRKFITALCAAAAAMAIVTGIAVCSASAAVLFAIYAVLMVRWLRAAKEKN